MNDNPVASKHIYVVYIILLDTHRPNYVVLLTHILLKHFYTWSCLCVNVLFWFALLLLLVCLT